MLRRLLFVALMLRPWAVGVASEGGSTPLPWVAIPTQGTIISLVEDDDENRPTTLTLLDGRAAVRALGNDDQRLLVRLGDIVISIQEGTILIDQNNDGCFVAVVAGFALVRDSRVKDRGILLQSRQGIAAKADGTLTDVLTFSRVPRLEDPEPLALQALAEEDDEDWPMDVAPIERMGIQEPLPLAVVVAPGEAANSAEPADPADPAEPADPSEPSEPGVAIDAEGPAHAIPDPVEAPADLSTPELTSAANPEVSAEHVAVPTQQEASPRPARQPAWMQRGRR